MADVIPEQTARFVRAMAPDADDVVAAMEEYGETHGPTTIGRDVGVLFSMLARTADAERVFEFGSGYGYSGYWFAQAVGDGGEVVLTDHSEANLAQAREFFERGGVADRAAFEAGDAHDVFERYDGDFDVVLLDHAKESYRDAFELARDRVRPGGLLVADNAMVSTSLRFDDLVAIVEGEDVETNDSTRGVGDYLLAVRDDPDYETVALPIGEGVAVSRRLD
jgi:predicted O-methyltransferase YrrM